MSEDRDGTSTLIVKHEDGSITASLDGNPIYGGLTFMGLATFGAAELQPIDSAVPFLERACRAVNRVSILRDGSVMHQDELVAIVNAVVEQMDRNDV